MTAFLDPWGDAGDTGFQAVQALTAIGSGGLFGVGLGESVQKIFYLPEAHTDMILAIIGEELGVFGRDRRGLALRDDRLRRPAHRAGGARPLLEAPRGRDHLADPLPGDAELLRGARAWRRSPACRCPFISYGSTNLIVLLGMMGLLLNVAATGGMPGGPRLEAIDGGHDGNGRDRDGRDGRPRGSRPSPWRTRCGIAAPASSSSGAARRGGACARRGLPVPPPDGRRARPPQPAQGRARGRPGGRARRAGRGGC